MKRGNIRKRGGSWAVVVSAGTDADGRRKRIQESYATRAEAEIALTRLLHQVDTGADADAGSLTVRDFFGRWLAHKAGRVRDGTL